MENKNVDFKDLWKQQIVSPSNMEELLSKLKHFKKISLRKLVLTNVLLVATCVFIFFIWYYYQPEFMSTKIGIVVNVAIMGVYLLFYNRLFSDFKRIDSTNSNAKYLQKLIDIKTKQKFLQSKMLSIYFIVLGIGLCLYMYEYTSKMSVLWAVIAYLLVFFWGGFVWLYMRPKEIKKEEAKINFLIDKFKRINDQLEEG